jgi:hypothetical protein
VTLAGGVVECCALLFAVGLAFGLLFGGRIAYGRWQDRQEQRATLHQARRDCAGRYDPEEGGTAKEQFDGCVSDPHGALDLAGGDPPDRVRLHRCALRPLPRYHRADRLSRLGLPA